MSMTAAMTSAYVSMMSEYVSTRAFACADHKCVHTDDCVVTAAVYTETVTARRRQDRLLMLCFVYR